MEKVVNGSARSCGVLIAVTLGLLFVMLQGATHHIAQDAVAIGHDTMENHIPLLDPPMRNKMRLESVPFWSNSYLHCPRANDRW